LAASVVAESIACDVIEFGIYGAHFGHEGRVFGRSIIGSISLRSLEASHSFHDSRLDEGAEVFGMAIAHQSLYRLDNVPVQSEGFLDGALFRPRTSLDRLSHVNSLRNWDSIKYGIRYD
jgi:hypothetical protein